MGVPEFDIDGSKYDNDTYLGRFRGFLEVIDPRCLFITDDELKNAQKTLEDYKEFKKVYAKRLPPNMTDEQLWDAKQTIESVIHPPTGEKINPAFRMAAFLPVNIPLVAGMLNFPSLAGTVFWQWANQSYNSAFNYANRAGQEVDTDELMKSYAVAVSVSCSLALGFRFLSQRGPRVVQRIASIPFVVPYIAVASAGSANVYLSRQNELESGVKVFDANNVEKGVSKEAAKQGVIKTILSRSVGLPIPVLVLPHLMMKMAPRNLGKRGLMFFELTAITVSIAIGLPAAIAIFPQKSELDVKSLEDEFQNLVDEKGEKIEKLYSNKGL